MARVQAMKSYEPKNALGLIRARRFGNVPYNDDIVRYLEGFWSKTCLRTQSKGSYAISFVRDVYYSWIKSIG